MSNANMQMELSTALELCINTRYTIAYESEEYARLCEEIMDYGMQLYKDDYEFAHFFYNYIQ